MSDAQETHRTGFVALSGLPNAGKSTLLNAILGQTISIVSPKPQTTRNRIIGIHNLPGAQIILVDTPGLAKGRHELGRRMYRGACEAAADADLVIKVIDATKFELRGVGAATEATGGGASMAGKPVVVALNKVDIVRPKEKLLPMIERLTTEEPSVEVVVPVSALKKSGLDRLVNELVQRLPFGPPLFPEEMITDRPERFLAAELVRSAILRHTRQEVPHATAVAVTAWREGDKGCFIEAVIYVEKNSQKAILIGRSGAMIKAIGSAARQEIARTLGYEVHLTLRVDVASGWRGDPSALRDFGYDE